jgi:hypothetical protein
MLRELPGAGYGLYLLSTTVLKAIAALPRKRRRLYFTSIDIFFYLDV